MELIPVSLRGKSSQSNRQFLVIDHEIFLRNPLYPGHCSNADAPLDNARVPSTGPYTIPASLVLRRAQRSLALRLRGLARTSSAEARSTSLATSEYTPNLPAD